MKQTIIAFFFILTTSLVFGQNPIDRAFNLTIAFDAALVLPISSPEERLSVLIPDFSTLQEQYNFELKYAFVFSEDDLARMEREALRVSRNSNSIANLRNVFSVKNDALTDEEIKSLQKELSQLQGIRYAELVNNKPIAPPFDIPPTTPNYENYQSYLNPNPGVDMRYAWARGITGQGIRIRNVEYGFNKQHEEFHENERIFLIPGYTISEGLTTDYTEHGTATFGVLFGINGDYGVTGMVYSAEEAILFPEYSPELDYSRTQAVSLAINNSQEGDCILYEMQTGGYDAYYEDPNYVPAEYEYPIWDLTKAGSDMGIIIVAAAGNGEQNLDDSVYVDYMNRGNSGAIIVGAGSPDASHNKLNYSTCGARVNLQGWGYNVLSSGYGDYARIGDDFNQQYTKFSGTSSAMPIVASCVVAVQSYYHSVTGQYMNSEEMIDLLQATGTPQGTGGTPGNIGPLPNMRLAIEALDSQFSNIETFQKLQVSTYPNPFKEVFYIKGMTVQEKELQLYDILGKAVDFSFNKEENAIRLQNVNSGVYFLNIHSKDGKTVVKVIKE